ncbi:hypothetical protein CRG98_000287 [Punica granatum]|uniref:Retrotransposon Copia-like N-terminal domain-containing protein n=1 Tax=Punica granatum TaxID=22663 RepID=A0A2I0LF80_PUNGR|nr:hypothetical protein CRG98_000287 [Punica granatum]
MSNDTDTSSQTIDPPAPVAVHLPQITSHVLPSSFNLFSASITAPNITNLVRVQLNNSNYLVKKTLFSTFLKSHDLFGLVDGSQPCPDPTDLTYSAWCQLDQNVRSWLFSTLSESLLEEVHDLGTTKQVWDGLHNRLVERSWVMYRDIKVELTRMKLEDQGVENLKDGMEVVANTKIITEGVAEAVVDSMVVGLGVNNSMVEAMLVVDLILVHVGALLQLLMAVDNRANSYTR